MANTKDKVSIEKRLTKLSKVKTDITSPTHIPGMLMVISHDDQSLDENVKITNRRILKIEYSNTTILDENDSVLDNALSKFFNIPEIDKKLVSDIKIYYNNGYNYEYVIYSKLLTLIDATGHIDGATNRTVLNENEAVLTYTINSRYPNIQVKINISEDADTPIEIIGTNGFQSFRLTGEEVVEYDLSMPAFQELADNAIEYATNLIHKEYFQ